MKKTTHCKKGHKFIPENTYVYPNGRRRCRACLSSYQQRWAKDNPDKVRQKKKTYNEKHKEEVAESCKSWRFDNRNHLKEYRVKYRRTNYDQIKKWNEENRDRTRNYSHNWRASKLASRGVISSDIIKILFYLQKGKCYYCEKLLDDYHLEHKQPLSRGGKHEDKNLVLSCPRCNLQKGNKTEEEFAKYRKAFEEVENG